MLTIKGIKDKYGHMASFTLWQKMIKHKNQNFHPTYSTAYDYKIRYTVKDLIFSGAHMTDIIKDYEEDMSGNEIS
jgi:hypothetical protein